MTIYERPTKMLMTDWARENLKLGQTFSKDDAVRWFAQHYPIKANTVSMHVEVMSINNGLRKHFPSIKHGSGHDLFYKLGSDQFRLWQQGADPRPRYKQDFENTGENTGNSTTDGRVAEAAILSRNSAKRGLVEEGLFEQRRRRPDQFGTREVAAITNRERVGKALDLLKEGLRPFVERELKAHDAQGWLNIVRQSVTESQARMFTKNSEPPWDAASLLAVMWNQWNEVFRTTLGRSERSLVSELRDYRNRWAHQQSFSADDAYRAVDSVGRLLAAVSAPEADGIEKIKTELLRVRFDEQMRGVV
jgi:hypothetical protein